MQFPQTPTFHLRRKRALVTGASSGIGLACAVALAEHGAEVTLASTRFKLDPRLLSGSPALWAQR